MNSPLKDSETNLLSLFTHFFRYLTHSMQISFSGHTGTIQKSTAEVRKKLTERTLNMQNTGTDDGHMIDYMAMFHK